MLELRNITKQVGAETHLSDISLRRIDPAVCRRQQLRDRPGRRQSARLGLAVHAGRIVSADAISNSTRVIR